MTELDFLFHIVILALAAWRVSSMLATEDGPFQIFERMRVRMGIRYDAHSQPYYPGWVTVAQELSFTQKQIDRPWDFPAVLPVYLWWNFGCGLCCVWCNSVWLSVVAVPLYLLWPFTVVSFALLFALSALVIVIEKIAR